MVLSLFMILMITSSVSTSSSSSTPPSTSFPSLFSFLLPLKSFKGMSMMVVSLATMSMLVSFHARRVRSITTIFHYESFRYLFFYILKISLIIELLLKLLSISSVHLSSLISLHFLYIKELLSIKSRKHKN